MRVFTLFFLLQISLFAQELKPVTIHLTEKDGLPDIEFYDIIEDKKGFIWLAADKGLYRYNGKTFKNYTHPKKKGLSVFGLKFDHKNRLWCNNISGQFFYVENDSLKFFTELKKNYRGLLSEFYIHKNKLITSITKSAIEIDLGTKEQREIFIEPKLWSSIFVHKDTLFNSKMNILRYKVDDVIKIKDSVNIKNIAVNLSLRGKNLGKNNDAILQAVGKHRNKRRFFLKTTTKIIQLNNDDLNLDSEIIRTFTEKDEVWFATSKGVYKYKYHKEKLTFIEKIFSDKIITNIIKDKNDNYWFTSLRNGIYIIPNINVNFYSSTESKNISSLEKINDKELIYGTTKGEIFIKSIKNKKIRELPFFLNKKISKLSFNGVNKAIISSTDKGYILNLKSKKLKKIDSIKTDIGMANAKDISFINENTFVFGSFANAEIFNLKNKSNITIGTRRTYSTHYNKITKKVYVGYVDGVEYYKEDLKPNKITFNNEPIFAIDIDNTSDNTVWLSTFSDGIIGLKNGKVIYNYTTKNGLLSNQTSTIKADGNKLWIVTDKGIQCFNTKDKTFNSLTRKDGLKTSKVSDIAIFKTKVVLGTNNGLFEINKSKAFKPVKLSDFFFTKTFIEDKEVSIKNSYNLSSDVNKVQFQFHTNGYLSEENINYRYRLLGSSNKWMNVPDKSNQITFNSLSAGSYIFQLKKVSTIADIETAVKSIKIKINKPIYKEWWFVFLVMIIIGTIIIIYFKRKLRKKEKSQKLLLEQKEKEKEMVFLKLENLRSQMNPHFIFNALNSIQDYILLNQKNLAGDYLGKFADLIRLYLNYSSKVHISLSEEIVGLEKYLELEKLRFEDSLDYYITTSKRINSDDIKIPTMLVQPYVENALKHGLLHRKKNRVLTIDFLLDNAHYITCIVTDNGIGRKKREEIKKRTNHKPFATKANQDRLELLNYGRKEKIEIKILDLYTKNNKVKGTQVIIQIPYIKS